MGLLSWLVDLVSPVSGTSGRAGGPLICAHIYSYWAPDETRAPAGSSADRHENRTPVSE
jgi:hypothetical protein